MKLLPGRKARSLQGIIAYHSYLFCNDNNTCDDPNQWDVKVFKSGEELVVWHILPVGNPTICQEKN